MAVQRWPSHTLFMGFLPPRCDGCGTTLTLQCALDNVKYSIAGIETPVLLITGEMEHATTRPYSLMNVASDLTIPFSESGHDFPETVAMRCIWA